MIMILRTTYMIKRILNERRKNTMTEKTMMTLRVMIKHWSGT